jgi:peptidoglycan hydrolase CwlO-like protein
MEHNPFQYTNEFTGLGATARWGHPNLSQLLDTYREGLEAQKCPPEEIDAKVDKVGEEWTALAEGNTRLQGEVNALNNRLQERDALLEKYRALDSTLKAKDSPRFPNHTDDVLSSQGYDAAAHPMAQAADQKTRPSVTLTPFDEREKQLEVAEEALAQMEDSDEGFVEAQQKVTLLKRIIQNRTDAGEG